MELYEVITIEARKGGFEVRSRYISRQQTVSSDYNLTYETFRCEGSPTPAIPYIISSHDELYERLLIVGPGKAEQKGEKVRDSRKQGRGSASCL